MNFLISDTLLLFKSKTFMFIGITTILKFTALSQIPLPPPSGIQIECNAGSNPIITKFDSGKKWKVVVSGQEVQGTPIIQEINYKATSGSDNPSQAWTWKLGLLNSPKGGNEWGISPIGSSWMSAGKCFIPKLNLPTSNDVFGSTIGTLQANQGSFNTVASEPVQVFFRKDDKNIHNSAVPNWFYYWSQLFKNNLSLECIKLFDENTKSFKSVGNFEIFLKYWDKGRYKWPPTINSNGEIRTTYGESHIASTIPFLSGSVPNWKFVDTGTSSFGLPGPLGDGKRYCCSGLPDIQERYILIGKGCGYYFHSRTAPTDPEGIEVLS